MVNILPFLDSNGFQTLIVFLVGLFAFVNYRIAKIDEKRNAASIIIMEIRDIEEQIDAIKDIEDYYNTNPIITANSWEKYKYLFANELDQDEYKLIADFYVTACRIEEERSVIRQQICVTYVEKAKLLQKNISEQAYDCIGKEDEYFRRAQGIATLMWKNNPVFEGDMPKNLLQKLVRECKYVTVTTAGKKLKEIASKR